VFDLDDLKRITRQGAGELNASEQAGEVLDTSFEALGHDSLALLEIAARIGREFGVDLPEDDVDIALTPRQLIGMVNASLAEPAGVNEPGHVEHDIVIDAPMDLLWEITNDVERWPDMITEYAAVEILERRGNTVRFRLTTHPDENGNVWSWVSERTPDPVARTVRARRVETGPFEFMHIAWDYTPVPDGIRMRWMLDFRVKPTAPFTTAMMTDRFNHGVPRELRLIKKLVEAAAADREASTS
jgi:aromatase